MGRRALRKIDPGLDLTGHLQRPDQLPAVCTSRTLFGRQAPLEIEVGSGKGLFLTVASGDRPDVVFLGIEVSAKYARFAAANLARHHRDNALMVQGDAVALLHERVPESSVQAVHVYFPDPWWKKRHKKRRVMNPAFVQDIQRILQRGGSLHFWTDVEEYFRTSVELIGQVSELQGPRPIAPRPAEHELDYRTHFERRTRLHGQPVCRSQFVKPMA
jgi:tRNA (guanine-N7-)-methyltransferase